MFEAEPPAVKDLLAPDETVINPYYMRQLLQYGIKLGEAQSSDMSPEALLREAEVSSNHSPSYFSVANLSYCCSDWWQSSSQSSHSTAPAAFCFILFISHSPCFHCIHARTTFALTLAHTHTYHVPVRLFCLKKYCACAQSAPSFAPNRSCFRSLLGSSTSSLPHINTSGCRPWILYVYGRADFVLEILFLVSHLCIMMCFYAILSLFLFVICDDAP